MRSILAAAAVVGAGAGLVLLLPGLVSADAAVGRAVAAGALLGMGGSVAGFLLLVRNLRSTHGQFLVAYFGGMLGRWALFALVLAAVVLNGSLPLAWFLVGLIPSYLGFQAVEMVWLHRLQRSSGPPRAMETER